MFDMSKCLSCGESGYPLCEDCKSEVYLPEDPKDGDSTELDKD